jgi:hypothetical protein
MKHHKRVKKESSSKSSRPVQSAGKPSKVKGKERSDLNDQFYADEEEAEEPFEDNLEALEDTAYENYEDEDDDDY